LVTGSGDKTAMIWDIDSGDYIKKLKRYSSCINSVAFCSNSKLLATGSMDNTARIWDVSSGE